MRGTWHDARVRTTPTVEAQIRLAQPLERSIRAGHPWIYREALALEAAAKKPSTGSAVDIIGTDGKFVARGLYDARSPLAVRVATLDRAEALDDAFVRARLRRALHARRGLFDPATTTAFRWCNGEGDFLPGVVVDVYGPVAVLRLDGDAVRVWRDAVVAAVVDDGRAPRHHPRPRALARRPRRAAPRRRATVARRDPRARRALRRRRHARPEDRLLPRPAREPPRHPPLRRRRRRRQPLRLHRRLLRARRARRRPPRHHRRRRRPRAHRRARQLRAQRRRPRAPRLRRRGRLRLARARRPRAPSLRPRHHRSAELRPVGEGAAEGAHRLPRPARPRPRRSSTKAASSSPPAAPAT